MKKIMSMVLIGLGMVMMLSSGKASAGKLFRDKPKSDMVLEIEQFMEADEESLCRADDFVHIVEKYIPEGATRQEIMELLEEKGLEVEFEPKSGLAKYEKKEDIGAIVASRYYKKTLWGTASYVIAININKNSHKVLDISTGVGCGINFPWI